MGALTREDLRRELQDFMVGLQDEIAAKVCECLQQEQLVKPFETRRCSVLSRKSPLESREPLEIKLRKAPLESSEPVEIKSRPSIAWHIPEVFNTKPRKTFRTQMAKNIFEEINFGDEAGNDGGLFNSSFEPTSEEYNRSHRFQNSVDPSYIALSGAELVRDSSRDSPIAPEDGTAKTSVLVSKSSLRAKGSSCDQMKSSDDLQSVPSVSFMPATSSSDRDSTASRSAKRSKFRPSMLDHLSDEARRRTDSLARTSKQPDSFFLGSADDEEDDGGTRSEGTRGSRPRSSTVQSRFREMVNSVVFEQIIAISVLSNAASMGYDTQYRADHPTGDDSQVTIILEIIFCVIFSAELSLRISAYGCRFFTMDTRWWNVMDSILVLLQLTEQVMRFIALSMPTYMEILRLLRILRLIRVTRLVRSFHVFDDLRVITTSILNSASSLGWSLVLLTILMYTFSLIFLQLILNAGETEHSTEFKYWFGSLGRTFFTMFECIVGGVSWDEIVGPLIEDIGPLVAVVFSAYIAASLFAMMNLLTGVFVDKAMRTVREDKDVVLARRIRDLFLHKDEEATPEITWDVFREKLHEPALQDYFKQINVELAEAQHLFELLDSDRSGAIDSCEIVDGCLKLRGPARALDLSLLSKDVHDLTILVNEVKLYITTMMLDLDVEF